MQVAQVLFPALLAIVNSPAEYGATVRRRALQIAHSMAIMLAGIQGNADRDSSKAIGALLDAWFQPLCVMLSQPTTAHVQNPIFPLPAITTALFAVTPRFEILFSRFGQPGTSQFCSLLLPLLNALFVCLLRILGLPAI